MLYQEKTTFQQVIMIFKLCPAMLTVLTYIGIL